MTSLDPATWADMLFARLDKKEPVEIAHVFQEYRTALVEACAKICEGDVLVRADELAPLCKSKCFGVIERIAAAIRALDAPREEPR